MQFPSQQHGAGEPQPEKNIHNEFVRGSAWMVGVRWAIRLSGLVNTVILVRLLNPADFGIVAMAMIVVGMVEMFAQSGQKLVVIKHPNPSRQDFDTAWTMSVLFGIGIGICIFLIAPFTQAYFQEPRAVAVMEWLAIRSLIGGFENVGVLNFRRELRFDRQFVYLVSTKIISLVITIIAAFMLRNYWALVIGMTSSQIVMVALSYALSSYRPRFSLAKLSEMWSFSTWSMFKTIGQYLNEQVDQLAVGGFSGATAMGRYRVGSDVSSLFTLEILDPVVAVLFPAMASVQHDHKKMREIYLGVFKWTSIIAISTSVGVALCANEIVDVLLGAKWEDVKPLVPWLALSTGVLAMSSSVYSTFELSDRPRMAAKLQWIRLLFLAVAVFAVGYITKDIVDVAATRFVITLSLAPTLFLALAGAIGIPIGEFVSATWRPLLSAGAMSVAVLLVNETTINSDILRLLLKASVGSVAFTATCLLLWSVSGRKPGPEKFVCNFVLSTLRN